MKIISFSNQKGGVGKTTSASALASGLTSRGYKVLAVDLDPQCNLSLSSGANYFGAETKTLYDVFRGTASAAEAIIPGSGYDILVGGLLLAAADMDFIQTGREYMLSEALESVSDRYDYAIIDTPPTLGILTTNALTATDGVIIPMTADIYALQGLAQLNGLIANVKKYCNKELKIYGLLITKYNDRQNVSKTMQEHINAAADQLGTRVFDTKIRESVAVRESQTERSDFMKEAPKANATVDYESFIDEVIGVVER